MSGDIDTRQWMIAVFVAMWFGWAFGYRRGFVKGRAKALRETNYYWPKPRAEKERTP